MSLKWRFVMALRTLTGLAWLSLFSAHALSQLNVPSPPRHAFGGIQPVLSPDGQTIALSYQGTICRMSGAGGGRPGLVEGVLTRLTRGEGWDVEPAWSPDGKRLAYINAPAFNAGPLRVITAEDGSPVKLEREVLARGRVQFHPDGKRLLGLLTSSGQPERLQWYDLNSGALTPVPLRWADAAQRNPAKWALSPDGTSLLLVTFQDRPGEQSGNNGPSADVWRAPASGGTPQKIARWPSRIYNLHWDAAGRGAYVVTDRGVAYNDIWHVPLDRPLETAHKLTSGQADEDWPSVSVDGRWLLHTENQNQATALVRVDLQSGERHTLPLAGLDFREPTSKLHITIKDAHNGDPLVARLSVKQAGGKFHFPAGALYRLTSGLGHFYARQQADLTLPVGKYTIQAWHGPEYFVHQQDFDIAPDTTRELTLSLDRWSDLPKTGWFSGENHIHANYGYGAWYNDPQTIRDQCEGEDLHVANVVVANSDGDGVFDRQYFLGAPDPLSASRTILYWNEEFRSTIWGHLTLGHLRQLVEPIFTGFQDTTNPWDVPSNADIAERTHAQAGTVSYTHPAASLETPYDGAYAAKGLPVDAALGRVDTLDVMGGGYSASLPFWYRLLNCGFRIPAAAGTDVFLNRIQSYPPGWGRCYVKLTNGLNYGEWMRGQKAGRSFVTTGPMLEWTVEGHEPGDTLRLAAPGQVRVRARASSQFLLQSVDLLVNGRVVFTNTIAGGANAMSLDHKVTIEHSGWITVRCSGANGSVPGGLMLVAHGNPVYVEIPGHAFDARADAEYFLAWLERLEADLKKRDRIPVGLERVKTQLDTARAVYQRLAGGVAR
jgi:hypothetical protein